MHIFKIEEFEFDKELPLSCLFQWSQYELLTQNYRCHYLGLPQEVLLFGAAIKDTTVFVHQHWSLGINHQEFITDTNIRNTLLLIITCVVGVSTIILDLLLKIWLFESQHQIILSLGITI